MNKYFKYIFIIFLILFFSLVVSEKLGYYKVREKRVKTLTEEQIKVFEEDIKNGKNIDVTDYISYEKMDFSNNISIFIYKVSLKLEDLFDYFFKFVFNSTTDLVSD